MAKTTIDYQNDGAAMFRAKEERPTGTSWQAKAMQTGYDCAQTEEHDAREEKREEEKQMHEECIEKPNKRISIVRGKSLAYVVTDNLDTAYAIQSHIRQLETLADSAPFGSPAFHRYVGKIEKLERKYGITYD